MYRSTQLQQRESERTYSFPLTGYDGLRRTGFGLNPDSPRAVAIKLIMVTSPLLPTWMRVTKFCVHLDGDDGLQLFDHSPYSVQNRERPDRVPCCLKPNRLLYQLYGAVWGYFQTQPFPFDKAHFCDRISRHINVLVDYCIVCDIKIATNYTLLRSATCSKSCTIRLQRSQLLVRLPELVMDSWALMVHMAITQDAIQTGKLHVPPQSLPPMNSGEMIKHCISIRDQLVLDLLITTNTSDFCVTELSPRCQIFLSWMLTSYRGALVSMRGKLISPKLSSMIFFVNAKPEAEAAFAERLLPTGGYSKPVFHGTTTDRLQSILHIGLQTQTRPDMRSWGNLFGDGIYSTDTSEVALRYAQPKHNQSANLACALLICELAEPMKHKRSDKDALSGQACQVFVTTKPEDLILRAMIIVEPGTKIPPMSWDDAHLFIKLAKQ